MKRVTTQVKQILDNYAGMPSGVLTNLCNILMHGKLSGTGKMLILPVDQGFEHGPDESFASNHFAYDPEYHAQLAINSGLSAYAAPLGMLETVAAKYAGEIPLILKMNNANKLTNPQNEPDQTLTGSINDALYLGCSAVGLTIYPGSDKCSEMIRIASEVICEAKAVGLPTIIWSYPRGSGLTKEAENAVDVIGYAAHIAAIIGAHIIKVKIPSETILSKKLQNKYKEYGIRTSSMRERIAHIKRCAFDRKRIVLFSGGTSKDLDTLYGEIETIRDAGGDGSIIGRNTFQRPQNEAMTMLDKIISIYTHSKA